MASTQSSRSSTPATGAKARSPVPFDDDHSNEGPQEEQPELRRGPWTVDEDLALVNYISANGEGRWNSLAQAAGLRRTGKSCRLRWLNYLRPDVKRGNFTADEQLLILDLHTRWGNRWSKIAQHLPGRTDNEIKNYWRTRVQKHAKQLNCDANSKRFKDAMRYLWMPHLVDAAEGHRRRILRAQQQADGADQPAGGGYGTAADAHALSASVGVTCSSSDSFATSESYDTLPMRPESLYGDRGLFANVRAGEMLVSGGDWVQETNQGLWCDQQRAQADDGSQFEDPELSGWVQGFTEGMLTENFWTLEDIWKMQ